MGLTFKENCPDLRNTKVLSIKEHLNEYNCIVDVVDPFANIKEAKDILGVNLIDIELISNYDAVILAVKHDEYIKIKKDKWEKMIRANGVLIDVKSAIPKEMFVNDEITHWRL